ncbi:hypothetical protein BN1013_01033 [Candidatus Rubidus massiliensis]|nr:MAG: hypothetical protein BGO10_01505 [Chlamydia sp. 32-24]CDZ80519.1 hypothetical protein BN1013_01033 [Candidatus Rubidus massiliensis]
MNFADIQYIFNRAFQHTLDLRKNIFVFIVLALCGLLVVFFRGLGVNASQWLLLSLTFLPIFLCAGILFSLGIVLIRIYHDEIKNKEITYKKIIKDSWEILIGSSYFSLPIVLGYLLLWVVLGLFVLLKQIPGLGEFFGVILAFAPFLINFISLVLCILSLSLLFFAAPVIALKGLNRIKVTETLIKRLKFDVFSNLFLAGLGTFPLLFILSLLILAALLTGSVYQNNASSISDVLEWFFIMIPFTAILTPAIVFFFNFAAESHVLLMKKIKETENKV